MKQITEESITTHGRSGWLIRSADRRLGLAVVGETQGQAERRFADALQRRAALLAEDDPPRS